ncbi:hypothetical protein IJ380_03850 [Candidatus Saccharibacteria bacterium]|nr:hypothetical protein [Candidatus Saccharibacteria bacterium]
MRKVWTGGSGYRLTAQGHYWSKNSPSLTTQTVDHIYYDAEMIDPRFRENAARGFTVRC